MTNEELIVKHKAESIIAKYNDITNDRTKAIKCALLDVNNYKKRSIYRGRGKYECVNTSKLITYLENLIE